jgi:Protein of unknown function (DUF2442)
MLNLPKIIAVHPIDNYELIIEFSNHEYRQYDVKPLLEKEMFEPLKNREFFNAVKIEQGGYAVSWNTDIDISEYELWSKGKVILAHQQFGT